MSNKISLGPTIYQQDRAMRKLLGRGGKGFGLRIPAVKLADREKVAALMMRLSLATGHGDTIDDLLATLESEIERRFTLEYKRGRGDATAAIVEQQSAPPWYGKGTRIESIRRVGLGAE